MDTEFLLTALELKDETRTGWELRGVSGPETVAGHSWGTSLLCLLFGGEAGVDVDRCLRIAAVHDLPEAETGDPAYRDQAEKDKQEIGDAEKAEQERAAMKQFARRWADEELLKLWEEYETQETVEARFVKDMNMIDICLQALLYEREQRYDPEEDREAFEAYDHMDEFFITTEDRLSTETGKELFEDIRSRYEDAKP